MVKKTKKTKTVKRDLHQEVTNQLIELLESGRLLPWRKDWRQASGSRFPQSWVPSNPFTKATYHGINILLLWNAAQKFGFDANLWGTFNQIKDAGGMVKKGEKGTTVVFYKKMIVKDEDDEEEKQIPMLMSFTVFNLDQVEGLELKPEEEPKAPTDEKTKIAAAEAFVKGLGAKIKFGGNQACYHINEDRIDMPKFDTFNSTEGYYATLLHEHIHWTGHNSRLDRPFGKSFGSAEYAFEELVAELGSAFLCAEFEITYKLDQHASYLDHWLNILKSDKKAIFKAVSKSKAALAFLQGEKS